MTTEVLLATMLGLSFIGLFIVFLQQRSLEDRFDALAQECLKLSQDQESHEAEFKALIEWLGGSFDITWDEREKLMKIREGMQNVKHIEREDREASVEKKG